MNQPRPRPNQTPQQTPTQTPSPQNRPTNMRPHQPLQQSPSQQHMQTTSTQQQAEQMANQMGQMRLSPKSGRAKRAYDVGMQQQPNPMQQHQQQQPMQQQPPFNPMQQQQPMQPNPMQQQPMHQQQPMQQQPMQQQPMHQQPMQQQPNGFMQQQAFNPHPHQLQSQQSSTFLSSSSLAAPSPRDSETSKGRIDPNQIPSPIIVNELDQETWDREPWYTMETMNTVPPLSGTSFRVVDNGNASPRFIRLTTYQIPLTEEIRALSHIPLGMIIQPFARTEAEIPLIDTGADGPVRCVRCKAYVNPFTVFTEGGRKFGCGLCRFENEVPNTYFCNTDMAGRRMDLNQRPELLYGTVDYVATPEYSFRPSKPCSYLFALDVSVSAIQSGMLAIACQAIFQFLFTQQGVQEGCRVGFVAFDKSLHFFDLRGDRAGCLTVGDLEEVFVPICDGLFACPRKNGDTIKHLLQSLPTMFEGSRINETGLGSVAQALLLAMKPIGGKVVIFQTTLPTIGTSPLKNREDFKLLGTDKERTLYEPADFFWKKIGEEFASAGICVDMFLFPSAYIDIASIGHMSSKTGGEIFTYIKFDAKKDGLKFARDLQKKLSLPFIYDALLRVRISDGLKIVQHFGNFHMPNPTDLEIAGIDSSTSLAVAFSHDGKLDERTNTCIQIAVLYTTVTGHRRIRIHTLSLTNTPLLSNIFKCAEMDSTVNFLAKVGVEQGKEEGLKDVRDKLTLKCANILTAYRKTCATPASPGQLILPESLKLYPIYSLCLIKNKSFRGGPDMSSDIRIYNMRILNSISVFDGMQLFYPKMYPLFDLPVEVGTISQVTGTIILPAALRVSMMRCESHGLYVVVNGFEMYLWVGRSIPRGLIMDVFGVDSVEAIDVTMRQLPSLKNQTSSQIRSIIQYLQDSAKRYPCLQIVRQQLDPFSEVEFAGLMVEDKSMDSMNYVDYLCFIHRQIQLSISNDR